MPTTASILVDGVAVESIDARDRGVLFGDGLFETIAVVEGVIVNWADHGERLISGCARLDIPCPQLGMLETEILTVTNSHARSVVRVTLTRGPGGIGYTPPPVPEPTRIVARRSWPQHYAGKAMHGVRIGVARHPLSTNPALAGVKHLNRLDQVLASREVERANWDEALMRDVSGNIIEATRCNVFALLDGELVTPALDTAGVRGVMRKNVIAVAGTLGITAHERSLRLDDIERADELFLCNAIAGIWPVVRLDGDSPRTFPIGSSSTAIRTALVRGGHLR